jgi:hypothetical protein
VIRPCQILSCRYTRPPLIPACLHELACASLPQPSRYGFSCLSLVNYVQRAAAPQRTIDALQGGRWMSGFLWRYLCISITQPNVCTHWLAWSVFFRWLFVGSGHARSQIPFHECQQPNHRPYPASPLIRWSVCTVDRSFFY